MSKAQIVFYFMMVLAISNIIWAGIYIDVRFTSVAIIATGIATTTFLVQCMKEWE